MDQRLICINYVIQTFFKQHGSKLFLPQNIRTQYRQQNINNTVKMLNKRLEDIIICVKLENDLKTSV